MVKLSGIDPASVKVDLTEDGLSFKCITRDDKKDYGFDLEFYDKIVPSTSAKEWTSNGYIFVLRKKTLGKEYWPRLTKGEGDNAYIKVDSEKVSLCVACRVIRPCNMAADIFSQVGR
jgi:hypothetical protein